MRLLVQCLSSLVASWNPDRNTDLFRPKSSPRKTSTFLVETQSHDHMISRHTEDRRSRSTLAETLCQVSVCVCGCAGVRTHQQQSVEDQRGDRGGRWFAGPVGGINVNL